MDMRYSRQGKHYSFTFTPVPPELDGYPWPENVAETVTAADAAWTTLVEADAAWHDTDQALALAAQADKDLLVAALRAGEPDPGTPNQNKAARAEEVAWTVLELARADATKALNAARGAITGYLSRHLVDVGRYELDRVADWKQAQADAEAARQRAATAGARVGRAYVAMKNYTGGSFTDPVPYTLSTDPHDPDRERRTNNRVLARLEELAGTPRHVQETHGAGTRQDPKGIVTGPVPNGSLIDV